MKKSIVKFIVFLTILLFAILLFLLNQVRIRRIVYFAIYPEGITESTHVFEIFNDNRIEYYYGVREVEIDKKIKFKRLEKRETIKIKKEQMKQVKKMVKRLEKLGDVVLEGIACDALEVLIITKKNRINSHLIYRNDKKDKVIKEFVDLIEKITGITF